MLCRIKTLTLHSVGGMNTPYASGEPSHIDSDNKAIAQHLIQFWHEEIGLQRLSENLLPIEVGLGTTADAVLKSLTVSGLRNLEIYTAVLGDGVLDLIDCPCCKGI